MLENFSLSFAVTHYYSLYPYSSSFIVVTTCDILLIEVWRIGLLSMKIPITPPATSSRYLQNPNIHKVHGCMVCYIYLQSWLIFLCVVGICVVSVTLAISHTRSKKNIPNIPLYCLYWLVNTFTIYCKISFSSLKLTKPNVHEFKDWTLLLLKCKPQKSFVKVGQLGRAR